MEFKYKFGSLINPDETITAEGGCLSIRVKAFGGTDAVFTLNDGDEITVRDGDDIVFNRTEQLEKVWLKNISGTFDVLIIYVAA